MKNFLLEIDADCQQIRFGTCLDDDDVVHLNKGGHDDADLDKDDQGATFSRCGAAAAGS